MPCPACGNPVAYSIDSCLRCKPNSGAEATPGEDREQNPTLLRIAIFLCVFSVLVLLFVLL